MYRGLWAGGANDPGFGLSSKDLETIRTQLVGAPITIEHEGLMSAASEVTSAHDPLSTFSAALSQMEGAKRAVGRVSAVGQNDDVYFEIGKDYDAVQMLLNNGLLRGLSLTHVDTNGRKVPLELTLTNVMQRACLPSNCVLTTWQGSCSTMATPMDTATPELSPLEKSLAGMDEETRKLFESRFGELMSKITELESASESQKAEFSKQIEAAKAEASAAKEAQGAAKTNNEILAMQVKQLLDGHLPDQSDLGKMESQSIEKLISDEATTGEAFRQVVMACSRRVHQHMASLQRREPAPAAKAAAAEEGQPAAKRGRSAPEEPAREFDLGRALRAQFH